MNTIKIWLSKLKINTLLFLSRFKKSKERNDQMYIYEEPGD